MKKSTILILIIGLVGSIAASYYFLKQKGSAVATEIKKQYGANDPAKFFDYLKTILSETEYIEFQGWQLLQENLRYEGNIAEADKWLNESKQAAAAYKIPQEVALARGYLYQMLEHGQLDETKWKKISLDSIYLYR